MYSARYLRGGGTGSAVPVLKDVYWVGAVDRNIHWFHGPAYPTHRGTSYNAYLMLDEKITLVDTVHAPFGDEMVKNISELVPLSRLQCRALGRRVAQSIATPAGAQILNSPQGTTLQLYIRRLFRWTGQPICHCHGNRPAPGNLPSAGTGCARAKQQDRPGTRRSHVK